jgi:hypothetical protein
MGVFDETTAPQEAAPAQTPAAPAVMETETEVAKDPSQLSVKLHEIASIKPPKLEKNIEGFYWPTETWFIERVLFAMYGVLEVVLLFFFFVTKAPFFLLIPMMMGVAQAVFALTGFSIVIRLLMAFGLKQNRIE